MKDHTIWERAHEAAARKYRAAMSNGRGRLHEQMILAACRPYHDQGRANIIKVPEPFRVLTKNRTKGIATVRFTAHAQPDFIGCLSDGKMIAFEAKHTDTDRLQFKVITPTQAQAQDGRILCRLRRNRRSVFHDPVDFIRRDENDIRQTVHSRRGCSEIPREI